MGRDAILLLSVVAAALPALGYLLFIWWLDRYEREPFWAVAMTFAWGATGGIALGLAGSLVLLGVLGGGSAGSSVSVLQIVLIAPLAEEPAKALILLALLLGRNFDNTTDGLVYGAAAGLGFAMTENFLYFASVSDDAAQWQQLVLLRGVFTALMHCAASATFGAVLGRFRYRSAGLQWVVAPLLGYGLASAIHAAFNGLLTLTATTGDGEYGLLALAIVPVLGVVLFTITQLALHSEHRMIQRELEDEARAGVLPIEHARIIPFHRQRRRPGWLPVDIDRAEYVRTATLLAFRRHQARLRGRTLGRENAELSQLRMRLFSMLSASQGLGEWARQPVRA